MQSLGCCPAVWLGVHARGCHIGFEHHILLHTQHSGVIAIEVPAEILPPPIDQRAFSRNLLQRTDYVWPSSVFFQSCDAVSAADEGALQIQEVDRVSQVVPALARAEAVQVILSAEPQRTSP